MLSKKKNDNYRMLPNTVRDGVGGVFAGFPESASEQIACTGNVKQEVTHVA
jgi:hypothetical protein